VVKYKVSFIKILVIIKQQNQLKLAAIPDAVPLNLFGISSLISTQGIGPKPIENAITNISIDTRGSQPTLETKSDPLPLKRKKYVDIDARLRHINIPDKIKRNFLPNLSVKRHEMRVPTT